MLHTVTFSTFMVDVPPFWRLVLAIGITVGVTLLMVRIFHGRVLALNAKDELAKEARNARKEAAEEAGETFDEPPLPAPAFELSGRAIGLTTTAFVFLLAFVFGNFWQASKAATAATEAEAADFARARVVASKIAPDKGGPQLVAALEAYQDDVMNKQWTLLEHADSPAAYTSLIEAGLPVADALLEAAKAGADTAPEWDSLKAAVDDMFDQGRNRVDALPNRAAPGALAVIFILGITNLVLVALFIPVRLGANLFLMGMMAAITALLLFIVVEASNPYVGATAVHWPVTGVSP
jgi:hypothetical protein